MSRFAERLHKVEGKTTIQYNFLHCELGPPVVRVHMNVRPRSTMNTNGGTENRESHHLCS